MPPQPPDPDLRAAPPGPADPPLWRSRRLWHPVGYVFTGLWMLGVLFVTGGDSRHPLFDYIFAVPLAAWIGGLIVGALVKRRFGNAGRVRGSDGDH